MNNGLGKIDIYTYEDSDLEVGNKRKLIDEENDGITLDNWQPSIKKSKIIQSEWRKKANNGNYNIKPDLDDLLKIRKYLKNGYADYEIMQAFGLSSEIFLAIKKNKYCPVEGILQDNLTERLEKFESKIIADFRETRKKVNALSKEINSMKGIIPENKEIKSKNKILA
jgi:hypothetical protein